MVLLLPTKAYRHQNDIEGEKLEWFLSSDCVRLTEWRLEIKHFNRGKEEETAHTPTITLLLILCAKIMSIWRVRIFFLLLNNVMIHHRSSLSRAHIRSILEQIRMKLISLPLHSHPFVVVVSSWGWNEFLFCTFAHCQCGIEYMVWHRILILVKERRRLLCMCDTISIQRLVLSSNEIFGSFLQAGEAKTFMFTNFDRQHRWYSPVSFLDFGVRFKVSLELSEKSQQISAIRQE